MSHNVFQQEKDHMEDHVTEDHAAGEGHTEDHKEPGHDAEEHGHAGEGHGDHDGEGDDSSRGNRKKK